MDKNIAIEFQGVGKQYRLGRVGTGTLQHDLNRFWQTTILGKEDPYLKIGEVNDRSEKAHSDYVWALKDINFKVEQGDVVGIIGKNGAGKSTLLKLLSHITSPTLGDIYYRGRIASLLEVGTGFHGELTGKENIFMNGAVLGMTKHEIKRKLDDIIEFAGVEKYIDTPVKRYSSGMTVRLGFAVAAFLEPEILVGDEVLTVGDLEFQKRAIGKMDNVAKNGRTVLFVSHNMNSVKRLCNSGIVLKNGMISKIGTANECVDFYQETSIEKLQDYCIATPEYHASGNRLDIEFLEVRMLNDVSAVGTDEPIELELKLKRNNPHKKECQYSVTFRDSSDVIVLSYISETLKIPEQKEPFTVHLLIEKHGLPKGTYKIGFNVGLKNYAEASQHYDTIPSSVGALAFEIKYANKAFHQEYLNWTKGACGVLHDKELINATII